MVPEHGDSSAPVLEMTRRSSKSPLGCAGAGNEESQDIYLNQLMRWRCAGTRRAMIEKRSQFGKQ